MLFVEIATVESPTPWKICYRDGTLWYGIDRGTRDWKMRFLFSVPSLLDHVLFAIMGHISVT